MRRGSFGFTKQNVVRCRIQSHALNDTCVFKSLLFTSTGVSVFKRRIAQSVMQTRTVQTHDAIDCKEGTSTLDPKEEINKLILIYGKNRTPKMRTPEIESNKFVGNIPTPPPMKFQRKNKSIFRASVLLPGQNFSDDHKFDLSAKAPDNAYDCAFLKLTDLTSSSFDTVAEPKDASQ